METVRFDKIYCPPSSFGLIKLTEHESGWILNNGTGTNQIATESEAYSIGKNSGVTITDNKGCTRSKAVSLGCSVAGSYDSNQLVRYSSSYKAVIYYTATFIANGGDFEAQFMLCSGTPIQSNINNYRLSMGTDTYRFQKGMPIKINQPSGGNTVDLKIGETGRIYKVTGMSIGSLVKQFTHQNQNYTITWNQ